MTTRKPEIAAEVTPEIRLEVMPTTISTMAETQVAPPQMSPREELAVGFHSLAPDTDT